MRWKIVGNKKELFLKFIDRKDKSVYGNFKKHFFFNEYQRVEQISAITEENSAATEEVAASSEKLTMSSEEVSSTAQSLSTVAEGLMEVVGRFKV